MLPTVKFLAFTLACCLVLASVNCDAAATATEDRLKLFYERIKKDDVKYCADRTKMLPRCTECIPGLQKGAGSDSCNEFISQSKEIRDEIKKLTDERYGDKPVVDRPFGLYPCKLINW